MPSFCLNALTSMACATIHPSMNLVKRLLAKPAKPAKLRRTQGIASLAFLPLLWYYQNQRYNTIQKLRKTLYFGSWCVYHGKAVRPGQDTRLESPPFLLPLTLNQVLNHGYSILIKFRIFPAGVFSKPNITADPLGQALQDTEDYNDSTLHVDRLLS